MTAERGPGQILLPPGGGCAGEPRRVQREVRGSRELRWEKGAARWEPKAKPSPGGSGGRGSGPS